MKTIWRNLLVLTAIAVLASCGGQQASETTEGAADTLAVVETAAPAFADGTYTVAPTEENAIKWTGAHLGKNYEHFGRIMLNTGSLTVSGGAVTAGALEINMASIVVDDIEDEQKKADLAGHLANDDFFSVEQFPTATFVAKSVREGGENGATHTIVGDLTIKGITQEIEAPVTVTPKDGAIGVQGTITFDRTKFNVMYNSGSLADMVKDKIISDEVKLEFALTAAM